MYLDRDSLSRFNLTTRFRRSILNLGAWWQSQLLHIELWETGQVA